MKIIAAILIVCFVLPLQELYAQGSEEFIPKYDFQKELNLPSETTQRDLENPAITQYKSDVFNESLSLTTAIATLQSAEYIEDQEEAMKTIRGLARGSLVEKNRSLAVHIIGEICINGQQTEEDKKAISASVAKGDLEGIQKEPYLLAITYSGVCHNSDAVDQMLYKLASYGVAAANWLEDDRLEVARAAIRGLAYSKGSKSTEYLRKLANEAIEQKSGYAKRTISLDENLGKLQGEIAEQLGYKKDFNTLSNFVNDKYAYGTPIEVDVLVNTLYGDKDMKIASAFVMAAAGKCVYKKEGNASSPRWILLKTVSNGLMDSGLELELRDAARSALLGNCGCHTKYYMNNSTPYIYCGSGQEVADYIDVAKYNERIQSYVNQAMIFVITWYTFDWAFLVAGKFIFQALKGIAKMMQKAFPAIKTEKVITKVVEVRKLKKVKPKIEPVVKTSPVKVATGTTVKTVSKTGTTTTKVIETPVGKGITKVEGGGTGTTTTTTTTTTTPVVNEPLVQMPIREAGKIEVVSSEAVISTIKPRGKIITGAPDDLLSEYRLVINKKNIGYEDGLFKRDLNTLPPLGENEVARGMTIKNEEALYKISQEGFLTRDVNIPRTRIGIDGRPDYSYEICFTSSQNDAAGYAFKRLSDARRKDGEIIIVSYAKKDAFKWDYDAWISTSNIAPEQITRNFLYKPGEGWVEISIDSNRKIISEVVGSAANVTP